MGRKDIAMTPAEIGDFLAAGRNLQVATIGLDGWPHLTTLWYIVRDGLVTFRSFRRSQRIVNLAREPRLTVLVEAGETYEELRGVMIKGQADLSNDRRDVLEVYGAIASKYQFDGAQLDPAAVEALFGGHADKNTVVTMRPERVTSWDHRRLGGAY